MKTTASNPARITVNPLVYLRRGGITAPLLLVALIVSVIAFLVVKPESEKTQVRLRLIPVAMGIFNIKRHKKGQSLFRKSPRHFANSL